MWGGAAYKTLAILAGLLQPFFGHIRYNVGLIRDSIAHGRFDVDISRSVTIR